MSRKISALLSAGAALSLAAAAPAHAEEGDYSGWQTFWNLLFPPAADKPVRSSERTGPYPLLSNPRTFDDGFGRGGYTKWQTVDLAPATGAVCGNGSPYKFFVNRVAHTRNTVVYMEGGGACWDYASCTGQAGVRGARNPGGIPDDYLTSGDPSTGLVSPFVFRDHPYSRVKTQDWNIVYVPYCTGDVYSGDETVVYEDESGGGEPLVWHHNGVRNVRAVTSWMRDNLPAPTQLLVTGCSAGGAGAINNYHALRRDSKSRRGFLVNDSGPIFPTEGNGPLADNPSQPLQNEIRTVWGTDDVVRWNQRDLPFYRVDNPGTVQAAVARRWPADRLGHVHFQQDLNFSVYSYERFYPSIGNDPDQASREAKILALWEQDTAKLRGQLSAEPNFGGYFPYFRDVNDSHCATIIDFENGDIQERGLELDDFIGSVLDGSGPVLDGFEEDQEADKNKPFNIIYALVNFIL
jgi:hypothetical protein